MRTEPGEEGGEHEDRPGVEQGEGEDLAEGSAKGAGPAAFGRGQGLYERLQAEHEQQSSGNSKEEPFVFLEHLLHEADPEAGRKAVKPVRRSDGQGASYPAPAPARKNPRGTEGANWPDRGGNDEAGGQALQESEHQSAVPLTAGLAAADHFLADFFWWC
jgi:hypothetical protein